ncbi:hypothetical protein BIT28_11520 [Photobacterium proteolyticum]|mgnify:CR=1 FL=1|uniref:Asparaginyl-tRNA synthetase n=2 Tax=Photobacterium TaxID=657 RepID=A0A1Q9GDB2_9GAMM|nr:MULTISPECIES: hypothetical protein [Photobacterium]NBI56148.1 hypothetical protein [Photobacterium alginatilyticum]OLQ72309.1 hypothetical protein BIT28_11520 [Photobacterium proteolyticum]
MLNRIVNPEIKLLAVSVVCAALLVLGHLLLAKSLAEQVWVEYTAAAIPFVLFGIGALAIRFAIAKENQD